MNIEDRALLNKKCLEKLSDFLEAHPKFRFIQALWALNIVDNEDRFYEEPYETLEKIEKAERQ